ncbi:MAG: 3-oxoadipyl-CoA thiolase [Rhodospirillaceae bacterium]|nr:MAG: 3-oxoadipyl-CoA thiolase [Rhodospirillaceae bacterium]
MTDAYICDAVRTPIGRYGGALSSIRTDDLGALPLKALQERNPNVDWSAVDDVYFGCANQSGEDNRNVARMSALLAGLPQTVPGLTLNRLCGSGLDCVGTAARAIKAGEAEFIIAGGVEGMSRAPFVMAKASAPFDRNVQMFDTTMGWRFVNAAMEAEYGVDTMPQTAENVAAEFNISREDQDAFAYRSQMRVANAQQAGIFADEIMPVTFKDQVFSTDEHPRAKTTLEKLASLKTPFRAGGTVTAGNASGLNDGACALIVASGKAAEQHGLIPKARIVAMATAGVEPRLMGMGPVPAVRKVLDKAGLTLADMDVIELNEAFAAQALAVLRELGLADDAEHVNANGGAIALGHPLGMSGARLVTTATSQLHRMHSTRQGRYALCTMCIGVGQGIAIVLERV